MAKRSRGRTVGKNRAEAAEDLFIEVQLIGGKRVNFPS
jgi:hypothetical protein